MALKTLTSSSPVRVSTLYPVFQFFPDYPVCYENFFLPNIHTTSARNVITTQLPIVTFQPFRSTRTPIVKVDTAVPTYAMPFMKPDTVDTFPIAS